MKEKLSKLHKDKLYQLNYVDFDKIQLTRYSNAKLKKSQAENFRKFLDKKAGIFLTTNLIKNKQSFYPLFFLTLFIIIAPSLLRVRKFL